MMNANDAARPESDETISGQSPSAAAVDAGDVLGEILRTWSRESYSLSSSPTDIHAPTEWTKYPRVYGLERTYITERGVRFFLFEAPQRLANKPGYWVGPVLLLEPGYVDVFMWGPKTRVYRSLPMRVALRGLGRLGASYEQRGHELLERLDDVRWRARLLRIVR